MALLRPKRTTSGYRLYGSRELERLEQIVALKFLGLPLQSIKSLLDRQYYSDDAAAKLAERRANWTPEMQKAEEGTQKRIALMNDIPPLRRRHFDIAAVRDCR